MNARKQYTGVNSIEFYKYFQTEIGCLRYLSDIKWEIVATYAKNVATQLSVKAHSLIQGVALNASMTKVRQHE